MVKLNLNSKVLILFLLSSAIPIFILVFVMTTYIQASAEKTIMQELQSRAEDLANSVDFFIYERIGDATLLSKNPHMSYYSKNTEEKLIEMSKRKEIYGIYNDITLIDKKGNVLLSTDYNYRGEWSRKSWFNEALRGKVVVSDFYAIADPFRVVFTVVAPINESTGIESAVALQIESSQILDFSKIKNIPNYERIEITNTNGKVVIDFDGENTLYESTVSVDSCKTGSKKEKTASGKTYLVGYAPAAKDIFQNKCWMVLIITDINRIELSGIIKTQIMQIALIILFGALFTGYYFSKKISEPINELYEQAKEISKGNFIRKTKINTKDELEELSNALNTASEALERLDKEQKEIDDAKTQFLSISTHELRSPMTPMKAQIEMLMKGYYGNLSEKQKSSIEIIFRNTERLDRIISDLLDLSRIEAARLKFKFIKTSLNKHINDVIKEMNNFMPEKKIKIVANIDILPQIEVDPDRFSQVLRNLINNAKKFSPKGSKITITAQNRENEILISVKDEGIGIPENVQSRIFEPFFQVEQTIYRTYQGTGLGLTICKGITEAQGGKIWFESSKKGTIFHFTVPHQPVKELKPIKLLFMKQKNVEEKLKEIFVSNLGPIGDIEFDMLKKQGLEYKIMKEHIQSLRKEGILNEETSEKIKKAIADALEVSEREFVPESIKRIYIEELGPLGIKQFEKIEKNLKDENINKNIDELKNKHIITAKESELFKNKIALLLGKTSKKTEKTANPEEKVNTFFGKK